jgi:predicted glycoside hydrolase/deacetylase ChbG (UPF0249 family)
MTPNPFLKKLGYSDSDRLVIVHTDDIGMCQASLAAFERLWEFGTISAGAVMVPCPWFPATAEFCRSHPDVDMGVHATLNCEWQAYRWGPLSTVDPASGLIDRDGYFHQWHDAVYENASPAAVAAELDVQVRRALAAGIDLTHIDSHMGTIMHPRFAPAYFAAGRQYRLPTLALRPGTPGFDVMGMDPAFYVPALQQLEQQGFPLLDNLVMMPLEHADDHVGVAKNLLESIPAGGITYLIMHPSIDTPELRALAPDWQARVANYEAFMSREVKDFIRNSGIRLVGWRALRDAMR